MAIGTWIAIYFTLWWVVLFAVLPFGVKRDDNPQVGNDRGAPVAADIGRKFLWTSAVSAIILALMWMAFHFGLVDYRSLVDPPGNHP